MGARPQQYYSPWPNRQLPTLLPLVELSPSVPQLSPSFPVITVSGAFPLSLLHCAVSRQILHTTWGEFRA